MLYYDLLQDVKIHAFLSILADFTDHYATLTVTNSNAEDIKASKDSIDMLELEITVRNYINEK